MEANYSLNDQDKDYEDMVLQAMLAWEQEVPNNPCFPSTEVQQLRIKLLREELKEYEEAVAKGDLENTLKELVDLQYVLSGAFISHGFYVPMREAFIRVHHSNMSKLVDGKPLKNEDGKVIKGPNYKPASLKDLVE